MKSNVKLNTSLLCRSALCTSLLCISAYINIPLPLVGISITAQTLAVNLTALILPAKYAVASQIIYTMLGIMGLPVFSGGKSGFGTVIGPTGGYIAGFIAAVLLISLTIKKHTLKQYILSTVFIGVPVIYFFGILGLSFHIKKEVWSLLTTAVLPFLPLDILKCIIASYIAVRLNRILKNFNLL